MYKEVAIEQFARAAEVYLFNLHLPMQFERGYAKKTEEYGFKINLISELYRKGILNCSTQATDAEALSVSVGDLARILKQGRVFSPVGSKSANNAVNQCCHTVSALEWVLDPSRFICTGFSDKTNHHSWLYSPVDKTVIEPTHYKRNHYYGYVEESPLLFVEDELSNIELLCEDNCITSETYEKFLRNWEILKASG